MAKNQKIDLQEIALKLIANSRITDKISTTGLFFTAKQISEVIPQLKNLGDLPLICLQKDRNGNNSYLIPSLYADGDDYCVCLPDLNRSVTTKLELLSWQMGNITNCLLKAEEDLILKCAIAVTKNFLDDVGSEFNGQLEGQGTETLNPIWLKQKPQIELPLRTLHIGVAFEVIGIGGKSRKYSTPMVNLKDSFGNEYHNVITNSALRNLMDSGCKEFMIKETIPVTKDKIHTDQVVLTPLDGADFSNLLSL